MKRFVLLFAVVALVVPSSAQETTTTGHKFLDNVYAGVHFGGSVPGRHFSFMENMTPHAGIRVGKNFTTVLGLAMETTLYWSSNPDTRQYGFMENTKTAIDAMDMNLLGTVNLSNLFAGYQGTPRTVELTALYGFGWRHGFGYEEKQNALNSKVGLDIGFNLDEARAWQIYVEPAMVYNLQGYSGSTPLDGGGQYNLSRSDIQLRLGVIYKLKNSNGTHNFALAQIRDQSEIDRLNNRINELRYKNDIQMENLSDARKKINELQKALTEARNKPAPVVKNVTPVANLQPSVVFKQGKSDVERSQEANIALIADYMKNHPQAKIKLSGYASPEGTSEFNQTLSEHRAEAVKDLLVKKYNISASRLTTEGLGETDKLFDELEFNRIVTFTDITK